jgi:hypothetical protein
MLPSDRRLAVARWHVLRVLLDGGCQVDDDGLRIWRDQRDRGMALLLVGQALTQLGIAHTLTMAVPHPPAGPALDITPDSTPDIRPDRVPPPDRHRGRPPTTPAPARPSPTRAPAEPAASSASRASAPTATPAKPSALASPVAAGGAVPRPRLGVEIHIPRDQYPRLTYWFPTLRRATDSSGAESGPSAGTADPRRQADPSGTSRSGIGRSGVEPPVPPHPPDTPPPPTPLEPAEPPPRPPPPVPNPPVEPPQPIR